MSTVKRGDTLIEVVLSFVMFSLVAAVSLAVMHSGISGAEASIELTLARIEIDSQSEVARFIQESFSNNYSYKNVWKKITEQAIEEDDGNIPNLDTSSCDKLYKEDSDDKLPDKIFILNPRLVVDGTNQESPDYYENTLIIKNNGNSEKFTVSSLNPRVIYTTAGGDDDNTSDSSLSDKDEEGEIFNRVYRAEGIYDFIVKDGDDTKQPTHYDLHVYTCWVAPGADRPTTIGTVTRLANPEYVNNAQ